MRNYSRKRILKENNMIRFSFLSLSTIMTYLMTGIWDFFDLEEKVENQTILDYFEALFIMETKRECRNRLGHNPYDQHSIPVIEIHFNKKSNCYSIIRDDKLFLSSLLKVFNGTDDDLKLYFNINGKLGHDSFFAFLKNDKEGYEKVENIINRKYKSYGTPNQNIRRLISLFYERQFLVSKDWKPEDDELIDYTSDEKRKIMYEDFK